MQFCLNSDFRVSLADELGASILFWAFLCDCGITSCDVMVLEAERCPQVGAILVLKARPEATSDVERLLGCWGGINKVHGNSLLQIRVLSLSLFITWLSLLQVRLSGWPNLLFVSSRNVWTAALWDSWKLRPSFWNNSVILSTSFLNNVWICHRASCLFLDLLQRLFPYAVSQDFCINAFR